MIFPELWNTSWGEKISSSLVVFFWSRTTQWIQFWLKIKQQNQGDFLNRWNLYLVKCKVAFSRNILFYRCIDFIFLATLLILSERMWHSSGLLDNYDGWEEPARDMYWIGWKFRAAWSSSFLRKKKHIIIFSVGEGKIASLQKVLYHHQSKVWRDNFREEKCMYSKSVDHRSLNTCRILIIPHLVTLSIPTYIGQSKRFVQFFSVRWL